MSILSSFFDVVAGVSILAGRSSLLDTSLTTIAGRNLTVRGALGLSFLSVGFINLWATSRKQRKIERLTKDAETFGADYDLSDKDDRIDELRNQIRYLEQSMEISGYGSRDVRHLHSLEDELAELRELQEFDFAFEIHNKKTGKLIEDGVITVDGFSEEDAKANAIQALEEGKLDDEEITFDAETFNANERKYQAVDVPLGMVCVLCEKDKPATHRIVENGMPFFLCEKHWFNYTMGASNIHADLGAETFNAPAAVMRTYKGRKSPSISAKSVKVGTRKRGNDGKMWQVRSVRSRGKRTQRWFKD